MWPFQNKRARAERNVGRFLLSNMEARGMSLENPSVPLSSPEALAMLWGAWTSASGIEVTPQRAMEVPSFWCGVNFLSSTIAALPLQVFKDTETGPVKADGSPLYTLLHDVVNTEYLTSYQWRKTFMASTLLHGRSYTYIEMNKAGKPANLWPLNTLQITPERVAGRKVYKYQPSNPSAGRDYAPEEIIDIPFLLSTDGISHLNPVTYLRNAIGLAIALEDYACRFFQNGGVPPLALNGPAASPGAISRANADVTRAVKDARDENRNVFYVPPGHKLEPVGFDPSKSQLVDVRRFQIEEIARVLGLPPVFLQDLTHGTMSNTEQQDLNFVKHTLTQWIESIEQELNAKLPGRSRVYAEFNVDGLLRGDFKTRMDGYATAIQNAIYTPDEARSKENLSHKGGQADGLLIQGATVPLGNQPGMSGPGTSGADKGNDNIKQKDDANAPAA